MSWWGYALCGDSGYGYYVEPPDTSIWGEWFDRRRWTDLYVTTVRQWLIRRWIWLVQRCEPRWRAGRWKAKT